MARFANKTEFNFRRVQLFGTSNFVGAKQLIVPCSRNLELRRLYFACNWVGFNDFDAVGFLRLYDDGNLVEEFRYRWSTVWESLTSVNDWQNQQGDLGLTNAGPSCECLFYEPLAFPNGIAGPAPENAIRFYSTNRYDGTNWGCTVTTMHPLEMVGRVDCMRFEFQRVSGNGGGTPDVNINPYVEVYVGIQSREKD